MKHILYCYICSIIFALVATVHLVRLIYGWSVQIDGSDIPMMVSWIGFAIPAILAFWGIKISRSSRN